MSCLYELSLKGQMEANEAKLNCVSYVYLGIREIFQNLLEAENWQQHTNFVPESRDIYKENV